MQFRRAVFVAEPARDVSRALSVLRRVAPNLEHLLVLLPSRHADAPLQRLRAAAVGTAPSVEVRHAGELDAAALAARCRAEDADHLVFASHSLRAVIMVAAHRTDFHVPILWADGPAASAPIAAVACIALEPRAQAAIEIFVRDHATAAMKLSLLSRVAVPADVVDVARRLAGIEASVEVASVRRWIDEWVHDRPVDLVVCAGVATAAVVGLVRNVPVLVVPPIEGSHVDDADTPTELAALRPGSRPVVLFDAELAGAALTWLRRATTGTADALAVRMRPTRSYRAIRARLEAAGLTAGVIDARAALDEGDALDVSQVLDPVRLARVASRLQRAGFAVAAIVHHGPLPPIVHGVTSVAALDSAGDAVTLRDAIAAASRSADEPPATTPGNHVELELDNAKARTWLLDAIERSTETLHLQAYMAADDDVGARVEAALAAAAARGVAVRVLVDSLHATHGSFGAENPLLARLTARPGVELRVARPITSLPSLVDLKQRDHRKLVIADGRLALLGGRNLLHEYYTGFGEVALTAETPWREVPWLDAGARVEGPLVAAFAAAFRDAWRDAGGSDLPIAVPPPVGATPARIVVHHGLRDACTLEAYLALIEGARARVTVVNGFPLVLELQHALLRTLRRGVCVRVLSGHVQPTHAGTPFPGGLAAARTAATELVHSRLDPIVAAGGDVYLFARSGEPGWAPGLGAVHPHVHAKVVSVDGRACAIGSANLDITASYWESELMLVVEDPALVRPFEAEIDVLIASSPRVDRYAPAWQRAAAGRAWMRHWPGALSF